MLLTMEKVYSPVAKVVGTKRVLAISDIHLMHARVPTANIAENLKAILLPYGNTIDALIIAGDLFDDSKALRQAEAQDAIAFISWLLDWAKTTKTSIRVIEGTPSHDHGQSKTLVATNESVGADVVYLDGIGIYYDSVLEMTIGWVQDEYKPKASETEREMAELMRTRGIDKVDMFIMHGCFHFQLPVFSERSFNEDFWTSRCERVIFIGHDHKPKLNGIIRVTGSPDRLSMNEEEEKGVTCADFYPDATKLFFHVNVNACLQITVPANDDYDAHYKACLTAINRILDHRTMAIARLRIEHSKTSPIIENISQWKKQYIFNIKGSKLADPKEDRRLFEAFEDSVPVGNISDKNVETLILAEMLGGEFDEDVVKDIINVVK